MSITFYTTNCPKCSILKKKLDDKNLAYNICEDVDSMLQKGITSAPALEIDEKILGFKEAVNFINNLEGC